MLQLVPWVHALDGEAITSTVKGISGLDASLSTVGGGQSVSRTATLNASFASSSSAVHASRSRLSSVVTDKRTSSPVSRSRTVKAASAEKAPPKKKKQYPLVPRVANMPLRKQVRVWCAPCVDIRVLCYVCVPVPLWAGPASLHMCVSYVIVLIACACSTVENRMCTIRRAFTVSVARLCAVL